MITDNEKNHPTRDNASEARQLLRAHRYGALSTLSKKFDGHPFGSITPYLTDHDGSLLILISTIAEHTKNIQYDPRVSLITHNQEDAHIQTQGRVTVVGSATHVADRDSAGQRYLRYFPEAQTYFAMHDFQFYRIVPQAIRYIGGFGKIHWVNMERYLLAPCPLFDAEDALLAELNTGRTAMQGQLIGIDCDGYDTNINGKLLRTDYGHLVLDVPQARTMLTSMP